MFDLSRLDPQQRAITQQAIDAADFPWERLREGLKAQTGRDAIPVDWSDLSRYVPAAELRQVEREQHAAGLHTHDETRSAAHDHPGGHPHPHGNDHEHGVTQLGGLHAHVEHDGEKAHAMGGLIEGRAAALGLAWYSGRISIERRLVSHPQLAIEVFLAEGAHMVDFFLMDAGQRRRIFDAFHGVFGPDDRPVGEHGHGWFEETGNFDYWSWVGEAFMGGFVMAYAPAVPLTLRGFTHQATPQVAAAIRGILTPPPPAPEPEPEPEPPAPEPPAAAEVVGVPRSKVFHRPECRTLKRTPRESPLTAEEVSRRRACRVCKPEAS